MRRPKRTLIAFVVLGITAPLFGCGPTAVRDTDVAGLDEDAMGTGLDRRDLDRLLEENMTEMQKSAVIKRWQAEDKPTLAVLPFRNETTEHVDSQLQALISKVETRLINAGHVRVISHENQRAILEEVRVQYSDGFDQNNVARWGKQVGARYFITGKVYSADERFDDERRVQYFLFMQVLDAETSDILFQNESSLTKAIVN